MRTNRRRSGQITPDQLKEALRGIAIGLLLGCMFIGGVVLLALIVGHTVD